MNSEKTYLIVKISSKKKKEELDMYSFNMIYRVDSEKIIVTNDEVEVAKYLRLGTHKVFDISSLQTVKHAEITLS